MTNDLNAGSLVTLPPEVLGLVCGSIDQRSLNALTRTCKILHSIAILKLYKTVILRVPIEWSRLPSLESLINSSVRNFDLIKQIHIVTQQHPLRDDHRCAQCIEWYTNSESDEELVYHLPSSSASSALNVLIRFLIARLPKQRLEIFRFASPESEAKSR